MFTGRMRTRWLISGSVQGVGYRVWAMTEANRLGLAGWVRNLPDGRVEVEAEGSDDAMRFYAERLRKGPSQAHVRSCDEGAPGSEELEKPFSIRRAQG
jgi:acylphosphatase